MKRPNWGITLIVIAILIAVFTNPSLEEHQKAVKSIINQHAQNSLTENDNFQNLGILLGNSLAQTIIENSITRDNYVVFSITKASWKGETKSIGYGLLGNIFLSDKVSEAFNNEKYEEHTIDVEEVEPPKEY